MMPIATIETPAGRIVNLRHTNRYDVYIGRAGHGRDGYFGNPCGAPGAACVICGQLHGREGSIVCFEVYARDRISWDPAYKAAVQGLLGKTLGCFCPPLHCHGEVLLKLAQELADAS